MGLKDRFTQGAPEHPPEPPRSLAQRYEYRAETLRSKLIGDKMDAGEVQKLLDARAREGWQLRSLTETEVKGRVGPGGTMGLLFVFERPV